jgi:hypothetical protein
MEERALLEEQQEETAVETPELGRQPYAQHSRRAA